MYITTSCFSCFCCCINNWTQKFRYRVLYKTSHFIELYAGKCLIPLKTVFLPYLGSLVARSGQIFSNVVAILWSIQAYAKFIDMIVVFICYRCMQNANVFFFSYHQNVLNGVRTSAALDSKIPATDLFIHYTLFCKYLTPIFRVKCHFESLLKHF